LRFDGLESTLLVVLKLSELFRLSWLSHHHSTLYRIYLYFFAKVVLPIHARHS